MANRLLRSTVVCDGSKRPVTMGAPMRRDVVEVLLEAHIETRQVVQFASSLSKQSATSSSAEMAQVIADYVEWMVPIHCADEDTSLTPRLAGRNGTVDAALAQMHREHLAMDSALTRVRVLCRMLARDISRLHSLRFELEAAAEHLAARVTAHQAFEEAAVFPALKRLLYVDELESIQTEMHERRGGRPAPVELRN